MTINWYDPAERFALIERVGVAEYTRLHAEHLAESPVVATENGHAIRIVHSERDGKIYMVDDIGRGAATLEGARKIAREQAL